VYQASVRRSMSIIGCDERLVKVGPWHCRIGLLQWWCNLLQIHQIDHNAELLAARKYGIKLLLAHGVAHQLDDLGPLLERERLCDSPYLAFARKCI
jgi:hypothetical protein